MTHPPQGRRVPWLKLALALSVLINFVALGMVWNMAARTGPSGSLLRASVAALPVEDRRALRRETGAMWRAAREADSPAQQMIAALEADDFDAEAFSASLRAARERVLRLSDQRHARLLEKVAAMSAEDRRAYAEALRARLDAPRWRGGRGAAD